MYEEYVRTKIAELRVEKGISNRKMSFELGHSDCYVKHIITGRKQPSMGELFNIIEYFGLTPSQFFADDQELSENQKKIIDYATGLDEASLMKLVSYIEGGLVDQDDVPEVSD